MVESVTTDLRKVQDQLERLMAGQLSLTEKLDRVEALLQPRGEHGGPLLPQDCPKGDGAKCAPTSFPNGDLAGTFSESRLMGTGACDIPSSPRSTQTDLVAGSRSTSFKHKKQEQQKLEDLFTSAELVEQNLEPDMEYYEHGIMKEFTRKENFIHWLDSWIGVVILANAIFIGVSADYEDSNEPAWLIINICFCSIFWVELLTRLMVAKPLVLFCGHDRIMNTFDWSVVLLDTLQLVLSSLSITGLVGVPDASLLRTIRLLRLLRLVRLIRSDGAKELVNMLIGLVGGIKTLMWSMGLFVIIMYIAALVFQAALGSQSNPEHIQKYFESVPRSMFTIFRCSFGDCSDEGGTPIIEHVNDNYGAFFALLLCLFLFFVVVGMFNVISAIFVEAILSATEKMQAEEKTARLQDKTLFAVEVAKLIRMLLEEHNREEAKCLPLKAGEKLRLSKHLDDVMALDLPCASINKLAKDSQFRAALNRLDIEPEDHQHLSSILDPDNSGKIDAIEFVSGVERLRGMPRRSDVVTVQLMIRSLQEKVDVLQEHLEVKPVAGESQKPR